LPINSPIHIGKQNIEVKVTGLKCNSIAAYSELLFCHIDGSRTKRLTSRVSGLFRDNMLDSDKDRAPSMKTSGAHHLNFEQSLITVVQEVLGLPAVDTYDTKKKLAAQAKSHDFELLADNDL
jgi:hypothetical protein